MRSEPISLGWFSSLRRIHHINSNPNIPMCGQPWLKIGALESRDLLHPDYPQSSAAPQEQTEVGLCHFAKQHHKVVQALAFSRPSPSL